MIWLRRAAQVACLGLFLWLFWGARFQEDVADAHAAHLFFHLDPLVLIATWLSAHAVPVMAWLALITVALTLLFGRVFCGWICPLGTIHHASSWIAQVFRRGRPKAEPYSPWQKSKYYLLVGLLIMALLGGHWIGVFDPISLLTRAMATFVYPASQYGIENGATAVYHADPHIGPLHATSVTEPVYQFGRSHVFVTERQVFDGSTFIGILFVALVVLNAGRRRFWCRYVCPLGGLLGWLSQRQMLRLAHKDGACRECGLCGRACPSGATPEKPGQWRASECFGCWNCVPTCNFNAITFRFAWPFKRPSEAKLDLGKRATLAAGAGGLAGLLILRTTPLAQARTYHPGLIRPPGAREERAFLQRCVQCGLCMKACPTNGLQPTGLDAGLEGLWTPKLVPRIGYCEYNCNLCGQVCPTEAIQPLTIKQKQETRLGLAQFERSRCLPWAYARECMVCEEHCPVPSKAIYFIPAEVKRRDGTTVIIKQPYVDPNLCIGCGICEAKCVFRDRPAVRVTSSNETRHPNNRPILAGLGGGGSLVSNGQESSDSPYGLSASDPAAGNGASVYGSNP